MSLDAEVQALLRSPPVQQISFTIRGLRVTGAGYRAIADCITADQSTNPVRNRIRITTRPSLVGPHAVAMYSPGKDKLHLRSRTVLGTPSGRATVVHECTHAQVDYRGRDSSIRSEETAAFIAEVWYLLNSKADMSAINVDQGLIDVAAQVRARFLGGAGAPVELTADELNTCRAILGRNYGYRMAFGPPEDRHGYDSDGIRGIIYRGD